MNFLASVIKLIEGCITIINLIVDKVQVKNRNVQILLDCNCGIIYQKKISTSIIDNFIVTINKNQGIICLKDVLNARLLQIKCTRKKFDTLKARDQHPHSVYTIFSCRAGLRYCVVFFEGWQFMNTEKRSLQIVSILHRRVNTRSYGHCEITYCMQQYD